MLLLGSIGAISDMGSKKVVLLKRKWFPKIKKTGIEPMIFIPRSPRRAGCKRGIADNAQYFNG
jgi:hypothetical protein